MSDATPNPPNTAARVFGVILMIVIAVVIAVSMIWAKWTFPRMRADQLMGLAWKVLTPLALVQLLIVGVVAPWL